jgi:hypothetical protein
MITDEEHNLRYETIARQLTTLSGRQDKFDQELARNNAATDRVERNTNEAVDILKNMKGFIIVVKYGAPIIAALVAIWTAWPK